MRTCTEYPPGRRPGRTVTLPDELAAVRAMRTFRPGVSPALPSRTRPRTGRSAPVRSAWGWAGRSTALRKYRGTARQLTTSTWRAGLFCLGTGVPSAARGAGAWPGPSRQPQQCDIV